MNVKWSASRFDRCYLEEKSLVPKGQEHVWEPQSVGLDALAKTQFL